MKSVPPQLIAYSSISPRMMSLCSVAHLMGHSDVDVTR